MPASGFKRLRVGSVLMSVLGAATPDAPSRAMGERRDFRCRIGEVRLGGAQLSRRVLPFRLDGKATLPPAPPRFDQLDDRQIAALRQCLRSRAQDLTQGKD